MRKVILLLLMLSAVLTLSAQGEWRKDIVEGDELKGTETSMVYVYTVPEMGSFVFWNWETYQFRLVSSSAQFNIESGYGRFIGSYSGINVHIGIYDDDDKLLEKFEMWLDKESNRGNQFVRTRDAGSMANPVGQKGKVKKIFKVLKGDKGYIRILTERFNNTDFDIKIPPYKE